jgi:hypothetical protein
MEFKVLVPGRYNDASMRADDYKKGDILNTTQPYGSALVVNGFIEEIKEPHLTKAQAAKLDKVIPAYDENPQYGNLSALLVVDGVTTEKLDTVVASGITTLDDLKDQTTQDLAKLFSVKMAQAKEIKDIVAKNPDQPGHTEQTV